MTDKSYNSFVFTESELEDINGMRKAFEEMTDREKFLVEEAFKPYFNKKKK